jgi:hypothetical protein
MAPILIPNASRRRMRTFNQWISWGLMSFMLIVTACRAASAQNVTIDVNSSSPNFGRPVYEAIQQLEKLSTSIPINYEDLQYHFTGDVQDVTNTVLTSAQRAANPNVKIIVPKGGLFSVNVPVDPATGKLLDVIAVSNALNTVISAAEAAGVVPGTFTFELHDGAFFVEPTRQHESDGSTVATQPVLDTPVSVSFQQTVAVHVLDSILQQVSQKSGFQLKHGAGIVPALAVPWARVSLTASNEPAKYVLARLLAGIYSPSPGGAAPVVSYRMLFDPKLKYYVVNISNPQVFQSPPPPLPYSPPAVISGSGRLGRIKQK